VSRQLLVLCAYCAAERRPDPHRFGTFDGAVWHPSPGRRIDRLHQRDIARQQARRRPDLELIHADRWQHDHAPVTVQGSEAEWVYGRCPVHGEYRLMSADLLGAWRARKPKILLPLSAT
jgi:hypothetical protein